METETKGRSTLSPSGRVRTKHCEVCLGYWYTRGRQALLYFLDCAAQTCWVLLCNKDWDLECCCSSHLSCRVKPVHCWHNMSESFNGTRISKCT